MGQQNRINFDWNLIISCCVIIILFEKISKCDYLSSFGRFILKDNHHSSCCRWLTIPVLFSSVIFISQTCSLPLSEHHLNVWNHTPNEWVYIIFAGSKLDSIIILLYRICVFVITLNSMPYNYTAQVIINYNHSLGQ